ncbi:MAG: 50S ribosomal protein L15 [Endomicrobium sp.]|jgi:large subunit ribosomal protein L15|nr:50S ribosomal protein L15 [Endomicrobium sp.]
MLIKLHNLQCPQNSKHRKKIVGRGVGSGHGRTATRGSKGQKSRSGDGTRRSHFEGGQTPIARRTPKRGFCKNNSHKNRYTIINIKDLNKFHSGSEITLSTLRNAGLISRASKKVKILGVGTLKIPLSVKVDALSKSALSKITKLKNGKVL